MSMFLLMCLKTIAKGMKKKKSKSITILVIKYKPSLTQHFLEVVESIFLFGSYLSKKHTENQTKINNLQVRL